MSRLLSFQERLAAHLFESVVAFSWALVGVAWLTEDDTGVRSPLAEDVGVASTVWSWMYVVAAPLILYGLWRPAVRWRVSGLVLLAAGLSMQSVAALANDVEPRSFIYPIYAAAAGARALLLYRLEMIRRAG